MTPKNLVSDSLTYRVIALPAWRDNFMYIIVDKDTSNCTAIDVVEPEKIKSYVAENKLNLSFVLTTHNHADHSGGNGSFVNANLKVYGGKNDNCPNINEELGEENILSLGKTKISVLETPFHTPGHVCYLVEGEDGGTKSVFTGDTMFIAGCGNLNTGTKEQLHKAFVKLGSLDDDTYVFVGHEYTLNNLRYAISVESGNEAVWKKYLWAKDKEEKGEESIPSTIGEEKGTSPFLRAALGMSEEIKKISGKESDEDVLLWVRQDKSGSTWKNRLEKFEQKL
eukprot:augustus_masked-scaffold_11-processed-gene-8.48-mRNA-1 protein AED:0.02 eAED:0.03 QI:0/-1/0/1/-1/1/1/0/280